MSKSLKTIVALCEGRTDVAFLRRLLIAKDGYADYQKIVQDIPRPLGFGGDKSTNPPSCYFSRILKDYKYASNRLHIRPLLPTILHRNKGNSSTFILLYDMRGMNKVKNYEEIINDFKDLAVIQGKADDLESSFSKIQVALAFIYDFDDKSKDDRIKHIKTNYQPLVDEIQHLNTSTAITNAKTFTAVGYHLLPSSLEKGNLENILVPLMKDGNKVLFDQAEAFLKEASFQRMKKSNPSEIDKKKTESDFKKSLIGTVGQVEHSGFNNAEIIKETSLFDKTDLDKSSDCKAILDFIKELRKTL